MCTNHNVVVFSGKSGELQVFLLEVEELMFSTSSFPLGASSFGRGLGRFWASFRSGRILFGFGSEGVPSLGTGRVELFP